MKLLQQNLRSELIEPCMHYYSTTITGSSIAPITKRAEKMVYVQLGDILSKNNFLALTLFVQMSNVPVK